MKKIVLFCIMVVMMISTVTAYVTVQEEPDSQEDLVFGMRMHYTLSKNETAFPIIQYDGKNHTAPVECYKDREFVIDFSNFGTGDVCCQIENGCDYMDISSRELNRTGEVVVYWNRGNIIIGEPYDEVMLPKISINETTYDSGAKRRYYYCSWKAANQEVIMQKMTGMKCPDNGYYEIVDNADYFISVDYIYMQYYKSSSPCNEEWCVTDMGNVENITGQIFTHVPLMDSSYLEDAEEYIKELERK